MKAKKLTNYSIDEYFLLEKDSDTKFEYYDGRVFALAGGTVRHGTICGNIFGELRSKLKNTPCRAFNSDVKIFIEKENAFVYPDTSVVCGDLAFSPHDQQALNNPILIVEVLSSSTSSFDRGAKFSKYRKVPSLQEYVLIEQDSAVVESFYKKSGSDLWRISGFEGLENKLHLYSLDLEIPLANIYLDVDGFD